jgi:hypothetical protein
MATGKKPKSKQKGPSPAEQLAGNLFAGVRAAESAPPPGARDLPVIRGVNPGGLFLGSQEAVTHGVARVMVESGRVFTYGNGLVVASADTGPDAVIRTIQTGTQTESCAGGVLANLLVCEYEGRDQTFQFSLPPKALHVILNAEPLANALPRIDLYSRRPLFGPDFTLLGPGYHPGPGYLIHGPAVEPDLGPLSVSDDPIDRLPTRLRELLNGFCFRAEADLVNTLGLFLTGVLINHFVVALKAVALVDGNQPGVGKTLLLRVLGIVLDGVDPNLIHYTADDEELQKRMCATLRRGVQSVLVVDNAKQPSGTPVSSPAFESNSMAPEISLRILGVSTNYVRPNDVVWALTMNQTRVSPDIMSRGLPIRLSYEGPPEKRTFAGPDPIEYAREHRVELLGELAGMVVRWSQAGRPEGTRSHRLHRWAKLIGGILEANGFDGFLTNYEEAAQSFNAELEELTALAEAALAASGGPVVTLPTEEEDDE